MIPEILERRIVRIPLFIAFALISFLVSMSLTFPGERVKQIVIVQAEQALNQKYQVTIADMGTWRLSGFQMRGLTLRERWTDEQKAEAEREAKDGAPVRIPFSVTIPRVGVRFAPISSITHLGLGAAFTIDFEDGGSVDGVLALRPSGQRVSLKLNNLDVMRTEIVRSVTSIPAFGTLQGDARFEISSKGKITGGELRIKGKQLTLGPGLVKKDTLPSAIAANIPALLYLEIPQANFGNMVFEADIKPNKANHPELTILKASTQGRDIRGELWGNVQLPTGSPTSGDLAMRLQFNEEFIKKNNLSQFLVIDQFVKGRNSENWYGFEYRGVLARLNAKTLRGSVIAAGGPPDPKAAKPAAEPPPEKPAKP